MEELHKAKKIISLENLDRLTVELPPKDNNADFACNAAMILAKINKKPPLDLGLILKEHLLAKFDEIKNVEVAKKGFLNITFKSEFWINYLLSVVNQKEKFGRSDKEKKNYNIEFVSANPTGPLHVGHCRGAVLGDAISNLLSFNNNNVVKEYYVNDYGVQIKNFTYSVFNRILEIKDKRPFPDDKDLYPGSYIIDIANEIINKNKIKDFSDFNKIYEKLKDESLKLSMNLIQKNLYLLGIKHDIFIYESHLIKDQLVTKTIDQLKKDGFVYKGKLQAPKGEPNENWESRDQWLFKSSQFGDDIDRALQKKDESWTYFASDIAYHAHKVKRDYDNLITILGADHSGYIKRIKAATKAVSKNKVNLTCKVSQLVKLFKNGKPFKMSKRAGNYITLEDLIKEVGSDSVRFMMLSRSNDVELDFDFEKVTEKSKENPVYYVQYANARINSIFRSLKIKLTENITVDQKSFVLNFHEIQILKKIAEWPKCVELSCNKLEPHRIPFYLYELVTLFHSYWNLGKVNEEFRFISKNNELKRSKLILLQALSIVIQNGMSILGVSTPSSM